MNFYLLLVKVELRHKTFISGALWKRSTENPLGKIELSLHAACLPIPQESYGEMIIDASQFRTWIDSMVEHHLELFPLEILNGYLMKEIKISQKLLIMMRRITIQGVSFTVRPAFVMPSMTGFTSEVENPLFLRKFDVPFWALSHILGKYAMSWYRLEQSLGRNSLLGTRLKTVINSQNI